MPYMLKVKCCYSQACPDLCELLLPWGRTDWQYVKYNPKQRLLLRERLQNSCQPQMYSVSDVERRAKVNLFRTKSLIISLLLNVSAFIMSFPRMLLYTSFPFCTVFKNSFSFTKKMFFKSITVFFLKNSDSLGFSITVSISHFLFLSYFLYLWVGKREGVIS